jgi:hypothetical protein
MPIRIRKLIGTIALLALVIVWALLAMAIAQPARLGEPAAAALYYAIAGLGWVLPAMPLIKWMSRPDAETDNYGIGTRITGPKSDEAPPKRMRKWMAIASLLSQ